MGGGNHPSIFALGGHLDLFHATVCFTVLIVLAMAIEKLVHNVEHYIEHHAEPHYMNILEKVIKELMILGVISFTIFVGEQVVTRQQASE